MNYEEARIKMIQSQIRPNRILDERIIDALSEVPREVFLPEQLRGVAYVDEDIPLDNGRWLIEPLCCARLLQAAAIAPEDLVLEVGCGPGYQSAVASRLAAVVVGLESDPKLAATARETLSELAFDGVTVVDGDLPIGLPKQSPFDVIVFGGAVPFIPADVVDQLAEGGRLVAVVRDPGEPGRIVSLLKTSGVVSRRVIFEAATPVLPGFEPQPVFEF